MAHVWTPDRRRFCLAGAALIAAPRIYGFAEGVKPLKIGVLNNMSSVYSDYQGVGSVIAAQFAAEDFSAKLGVPVEIVSADHQNKPDVGAAIARRWFDTENVDVVIDTPNSSVALAVLAVAEEKNKAVIGSGAGSSVHDRAEMLEELRPLDLRHLFLRNGARPGADRGRQQVLVLRHRRLQPSARTWRPIAPPRLRPPAARFSGRCAIRSTLPISPRSFLQAQGSGADVVAFANGGGDTNSCFKQAHEFGLDAEAKARRLHPERHQHSGARARPRSGRAAADRLLLGRQRRDARLREALPCRPSEAHDAQRYARRHVRGDRAPHQGDGRDGRALPTASSSSRR